MPAAPVPPRLEPFLRAARPAVIATLGVAGAPVTAATWFLWLGGDRLLVSMDVRGPRARNVRRDGRVALTVLGDDWYDQVSLRGRVVELRDDADLADLDTLSRHYRGVPYPRSAGFAPLTAVVAVDAWHEFRSTTRTSP